MFEIKFFDITDMYIACHIPVYYTTSHF